jgi:hypothetical protein
MAKRVDDLDFSQMSVAERLDLAVQLLASVRSNMGDLPVTQDDFSPELWMELQRRIAAFDASQVGTEPWESVMASLRTKFG